VILDVQKLCMTVQSWGIHFDRQIVYYIGLRCSNDNDLLQRTLFVLQTANVINACECAVCSLVL